MPQTEAQKRAKKKYDAKTFAQITTKAKIPDIEKCKEYAAALGLSPSKYGLLAMLYCGENGIDLNEKEKSESG